MTYVRYTKCGSLHNMHRTECDSFSHVKCVLYKLPRSKVMEVSTINCLLLERIPSVLFLSRTIHRTRKTIQQCLIPLTYCLVCHRNNDVFATLMINIPIFQIFPLRFLRTYLIIFTVALSPFIFSISFSYSDVGKYFLSVFCIFHSVVIAPFVQWWYPVMVRTIPGKGLKAVFGRVVMDQVSGMYGHCKLYSRWFRILFIS